MRLSCQGVTVLPWSLPMELFPAAESKLPGKSGPWALCHRQRGAANHGSRIAGVNGAEHPGEQAPGITAVEIPSL